MRTGGVLHRFDDLAGYVFSCTFLEGTDLLVAGLGNPDYQVFPLCARGGGVGTFAKF